MIMGQVELVLYVWSYEPGTMVAFAAVVDCACVNIFDPQARVSNRDERF